MPTMQSWGWADTRTGRSLPDLNERGRHSADVATRPKRKQYVKHLTEKQQDKTLPEPPTSGKPPNACAERPRVRRYAETPPHPTGRAKRTRLE